ncbi:glutamine-hydrolyzing carbamoyl-phosphate synthase small subunit [Bradymonas sediminis]|uniref:Carbamoyl phosphate synthase small chain n=1 Tax=Bradymonas sediminis TaxID=1548548 RepID=A0A2Z4FP67_9DELT|nr:glutamine-hydrolyzing carbamoyl-phosphate synthase small subunit [Bradymonas sediminis]AWV90535.1 carbamoyl-phosphate synthase small subunit [Bradymonas sediminis]TDP72071.1 carbamoyl-phosphate synthase small subunit [Bradymonas sediminis]
METQKAASATREFSPNEPAILVLEDGRCFEGHAAGAPGVAIGQAVFNTSLTGYQELLSDPASAGHLLCLSAPHIGNYGVNAQDMESAGVAAAGLIVRSITEKPSNHRADSSLPDWLRAHGLVAIRDVDTRALTRYLRDHGEMKAAIVSGQTAADAPRWVEQLAEHPDFRARDFSEHGVRQPTSVRVHANKLPDGHEDLGYARIEYMPYEAPKDPADASPHIVVVDFGASFRIMRRLSAYGVRLTLAPATSSLADIKALAPAGIVLSSGPGSPERADVDLAMLREAAEVAPTLAVSMGFQLVGRAFGAEHAPLANGHRGPNQPVQEVRNSRVFMTRQNRGYALQADGFPEALEITHLNLNDRSVEGFRHQTLPLIARQYDPPALVNPNDTSDFVADFMSMLREVQP